MKKVLVPLAPGCEELEAVTIIDILRRGGVQVTTAGMREGPVKASRDVVLVPDVTLKQALAADDFDMVVIPGGMGGSQALMECDPFIAYIKRMADQGKPTGAICAAPMILGKAGLLDGRSFTAYPGVLDAETFVDAVYTGAAVECDSGVITSRGPGTAMDFALAVLELLAGRETRTTVEGQLVRE